MRKLFILIMTTVLTSRAVSALSLDDITQPLSENIYTILFASLALIAVIVVIVFLKLRSKRKKETKPSKEEPKKQEEEVYFEPKGGEYSTEYY